MQIVICRSNPVAPDPRVEKEARALTEAGYKVQVIGWDRSAAFPVEEKRDGYLIHRIPIQASYGSGLGNLSRLIAWQVKEFAWLFRHRADFDILHACDFDTVLPCLFLKLVFGKKLIYDIFDFYPDHLRGIPPWLKKVLRSLDYWIINRADGVILVDDCRREQIQGTMPKRLTVIYNSPENSLAPNTEFIPSAPGKLRLAYVGIFQLERGLLEVLTVMKNASRLGSGPGRLRR